MCGAEMYNLESAFSLILDYEECLLHPWQHLQGLTAVQVMIAFIKIIIKRQNILW